MTEFLPRRRQDMSIYTDSRGPNADTRNFAHVTVHVMALLWRGWQHDPLVVASPFPSLPF